MHKINTMAIYVVIFLIFIIAIILYFVFRSHGVFYEWKYVYTITDTDPAPAVETHDFSCPGIDGFTFKYPVFAGWEVTRTSKTGEKNCLIELRSNIGNKEKLLGIIVSKEDPNIFPAVIFEKNQFGVEYYLENMLTEQPKAERKDEPPFGAVFHNDGTVVTVRLTYLTAYVISENDFSREQFFQTVTDSFQVSDRARILNLFSSAGIEIKYIDKKPLLDLSPGYWWMKTADDRIDIWLYEFKDARESDKGVSVADRYIKNQKDHKLMDMAQNGSHLIIVSAENNIKNRRGADEILSAFSGQE